MSEFEKLIKRLIVHEAFDKVYPLKNKRTYDSKEEVIRALGDSDRRRSEELSRKQYARNRMPWWDSEAVADRIHDRHNAEIRNLNWEKDQIEKHEKESANYKQITDRIIADALQRTGSPRKDIIELDSVMSFAQTFAKIYKAKSEMVAYEKALRDYNRRAQHGDVTEDEPEPPKLEVAQFRSIKQQFDGKGGRIEISISPMINIDENMDLESGGVLDIAFSAAGGGYSTITGGGDAAQVVATVMEFAFSVFCVYESAIKLLFPSFYKWKKNSNLDVIKFTPVENDSEDMNTSSKSYSTDTNKRGRLYTLGWERSMRKRVPDLELVTKGSRQYPSIYIKYKESDRDPNYGFANV